MNERAQFRDLVPYEIPSSWSALSGPTSGVIELPISIHWGPQAHYDLSIHNELVFAYQQVVREGTSLDQEALLDASHLTLVWHDLMLPARCRALWEEKFPALRKPVGQ